MTRPSSLHDQILSDIKDKILRAAWPPGHRIPFEMELADTYGVSRATMNKVLTQLTQAGFLERRRKLGTIVCAPRIQSAVLEITDIEKQITALGKRYSYTLLLRHVLKNELTLSCLHFADSAPFCAEERMIHLAAVPEAAQVDFAKIPPGTWLLAHKPWSTARHVISAVNATSALAKKLNIKTGAACLVVDRTTEFNGLQLTHAQIIYPGDTYQMVAQFSPRT
jgi:GntR family transcriptional regulator, histidine utilization repressor